MARSSLAEPRSAAVLAIGLLAGLIVVMGGTTLAVARGYLPEPVGSLIGLVVAAGVGYLLYLVSGHRGLASGLASCLPCLLLFVAPVLAPDGARPALTVVLVASVLAALATVLLAAVHRRGGTLDDDGVGETFYG